LALSGSFYLFGVSYLIWHPSTDVLAAGFASWPILLQMFTKFVAAMPFTFHCFNGVRHLLWDTAHMMTNKQVAWTGLTVVALTVGSALGLATLC
jgi:succinate dehydrogenase (ubiquinone) cytochrome b560 subunit